MSKFFKCANCKEEYPIGRIHACEEDEITARINLMENRVFIVKDGALITLDSPPSGYGQQTIHWESEKVTRIVHGHIQKI